MKTVNPILLFASVLMAGVSCGNKIDFDACGQIDATQVTVSAESGGKIISLSVEEGDLVQEGQLVGVIDTVQTALQIEDLKERMEGAKARIIDIERQIAPQKNQLKSLEKDLVRYRSLLESNAATSKQVDDLDSQIAILKSQISAQEQSWQRSNEAVRSEIDGYAIQLRQKEDLLKKCHIYSPQKGIVLTKYAEQGESVTAGKPLFKIADMDKVYVRGYFTTDQLADVKVGGSMTVIPDDGNAKPKSYSGRVMSISDQAEFTPKNIQTRSERADLVYEVNVSVLNDGYLRLGMYTYLKK